MELACTRNKLTLCSYTREMARCPDYRSPLEEKSLKITHAYYSIEQKPHEMRIGKVRNAIRCPRTVVVHLWNAPLTGLAMVRSRWLERLASSTPALPTPSAILFQLLQVGRRPILGYPARIYSACAVIAHPNTHSKDVQPPELFRS